MSFLLSGGDVCKGLFLDLVITFLDEKNASYIAIFFYM